MNYLCAHLHVCPRNLSGFSIRKYGNDDNVGDLQQKSVEYREVQRNLQKLKTIAVLFTFHKK